MKWRHGAINSTSKIYEGVDTRGGTKDACKGHIVVEPSTIDGKEYKWQRWVEIPETPDWVMDKMGRKPWVTKKARGSEEVDEEDLERQIPLEQVERMLNSIDPDSLSYEDWLALGMSIHSQHPDKGLEVWDKWSKNGARYVKGECYTRWTGFTPEGGVRMGTLWHHAAESGWEPDVKDKKMDRFLAIIEDWNKKYAVIMTGGRAKILIEKPRPESKIDLNYEITDIASFKALTGNVVTKVQGKRIQTSKIWLASDARRTYPDGLGLYPDGKVPDGRYNTWRGFSIDPADGDWSLLSDHIRNIICRNQPDNFAWFLDWCADLVQDPGNPKGCAIVLRGDEGAGKGVVGNLLGDIFGPHAKHLIDDAHLTSNFNAHMMDTIYVFADEITWGGNIRTAGKLKGMVTEEYMVGERKGVDAVQYRNVIHMVIASNSEWVIPAGTNSRRWFVLDVDNSRIRDRGYFNDLHNQLDNGGREAFLHAMLNRKIESDLRRAPETEALARQRAFSVEGDPIIDWWIEVLYRERTPVTSTEKMDDLHGASSWAERVNVNELFEAFRTWARENNKRAASRMTWQAKVEELIVEKKEGPDFVIGTLTEATRRIEKALNLEIRR